MRNGEFFFSFFFCVFFLPVILSEKEYCIIFFTWFSFHNFAESITGTNPSFRRFVAFLLF